MAERKRKRRPDPKDGIIVDLNRVTRRELIEYQKVLGDLKASVEDDDVATNVAAYEHWCNWIVRVVAEWPWEHEITVEGYNDLGMVDAELVDAAVEEAMEALGNMGRRGISTAASTPN